MPEIGETSKSRSPAGLNSAQKRRLYITCSYIDKLLVEIEQVLHETDSLSPFPRHVVDITRAQSRVLEDHMRRIREELLRTLAWQQMNPEPADIPATRSVLTHDVMLLRVLEAIVTRHGLVGFRARIASLAHRLEENNLEVALFGRVSSGKSSLLNALLGTRVLPVGVNPITAVPTKLRFGTALRAVVTFAGGRVQKVSSQEFAQLVTEHGNPGNVRSVVRAMAEVPSPRLKQGIVLVDTPGLGSLARRGAAETLAYLPACDPALLLIDAGVSLNDEDIGTLRLLYEGGIPSIVLLSKADLLPEHDLRQINEYIQAQLKRELGISTQIHAVSSLPEYSPLLDQFFEQELYPRFDQARSLRAASVARKIGALRDSVIAALETSLGRQKRGREAAGALQAQEIERRLRRISGEVGEQRSELAQAFLEMGERPDLILAELAETRAARIAAREARQSTSAQISEWTHDDVHRRVDQAIARTHATLMRAVETSTGIAGEMSRFDAPSTEDAQLLLREVPRFEMDTVPIRMGAARWSWMGRSIVRALAHGSLRKHLGLLLPEELHAYKRSLDLWSEQASRKIVAAC